MVAAFLESFKYTGHLFPVAFLRVYMGYFYFTAALAKYQGDYLSSDQLVALVNEGLAFSTAPHWFQQFLSGPVITYSQTFSYLIITVQFMLGISYLFGYLVRPFSALAIVSSVIALALTSPQLILMEKTFIAINVLFCWIGAGRCLGFDYYFYKKMRGIFW